MPEVNDVLFNIDIRIVCQRKNFENIKDSEIALEGIRLYGLAIHIAKKLLEGKWSVRKDGFLTKKLTEELETRKAILEINEANILSLMDLSKKDGEEVHINFLDTGTPESIAKNKGFYLVSINKNSKP